MLYSKVESPDKASRQVQDVDCELHH